MGDAIEFTLPTMRAKELMCGSSAPVSAAGQQYVLRRLGAKGSDSTDKMIVLGIPADALDDLGRTGVGRWIPYGEEQEYVIKTKDGKPVR